LLATFTKGIAQALDNVIQTGEVKIEEGQRSASADRATFSQVNDTLTLNGNVQYKDASIGATLSSRTLALDRPTGQTTATGDVKTTYVEQKGTSSGAMLSASRSVHVTAAQMVARSSTGEARYSGGARLWQGGSIVQAASIQFNRMSRTLEAGSEGSRRVSTVFAQPNRNGKQIPVEVLADHLHYDDGQRSAVFEGSLVVRSSDSTLRGDKATVILRPESERSQSQKPTSSGAPSEVQSIEATGNIQIQQMSRRAVGARLLYTADEQKFVLTGTAGAPPSIFDAEHGQVTGVSLTFFNRDGRVLVDSSNSTSITQTRLKK
jgi:lipopolysaccharide export system protein LptA